MSGTGEQYPIILFSPEGGIQRKLEAHIFKSKESILVACYIFTSRELAEALARAAFRKVEIKLVVNGSMDRNFLRVYKYLREKGIQTRTIIPISGIQHSKFVIFDRKIAAHGSYNFTWDAEHRNFENMEFTDNPQVANAFAEYFEKLFKTGSDIEPMAIPRSREPAPSEEVE